MFSQEKMIEGERNKFKIAFSDMLLFDDKDKPFLVIEPETSTSPKTFGRSIPVYTIAKQIFICDEKYKVKLPLLLIIVIPDDDRNRSKKKHQLEYFQRKIKRAIDFKGSKLQDFAICQIGDFREALIRLFNRNGFSKCSQFL